MRKMKEQVGFQPATFETPETFTEPSDYLRKRGIVKVGHKAVVEVLEKVGAVMITANTDSITYYYEDGTKEHPPQSAIAVEIPKSLWKQVKQALQKIEAEEG